MEDTLEEHHRLLLEDPASVDCLEVANTMEPQIPVFLVESLVEGEDAVDVDLHVSLDLYGDLHREHRKKEDPGDSKSRRRERQGTSDEEVESKRNPMIKTGPTISWMTTSISTPVSRIF